MNQVFVLQKILSGRLGMVFLLTCLISFVANGFQICLVLSPPLPKRQEIR